MKELINPLTKPYQNRIFLESGNNAILTQYQRGNQGKCVYLILIKHWRNLQETSNNGLSRKKKTQKINVGVLEAVLKF